MDSKRKNSKLADDQPVPASLPVGLTQTDNAVVIAIHAQPGAKRDSIVGEFNDRLKIALTAPPVDGKANAHLIKFLSKKFGIPKSSIELVNGDTSRSKRFRLSGLTAKEVLDRLD